MSNIVHYADHKGRRADKHYKATLFQGEGQMVGINCLEPGQVQAVHEHADQDKVYIVMEGRGLFTVGDDQHEAGPGAVIWAAAGVSHGVQNTSNETLVILITIAPPPR